MKVAIITDQHFGARKGNKHLHDYFQRFYDEVFFPELEKRNIKTVIDMGDTFDSRKGIDYWSLDWAKEVYYNRLRDMGVTVHTIVGNHTTYYKDTNKINSVGLLLREYDNIVVYPDPTEVKIGNLGILFVPWINDENRDETMDLITGTACKVVMGHLELQGFCANRGYIVDHGDDRSLYNRFDKVFSGHYHHRSSQDNVHYLGNPYEIYWNDVDETRGFHIFDTETLEHTEINNPFKLFKKIYYEDTPVQTFNALPYKDKIVKIIVKKKSNSTQFEKFVDKIYSAGVQDVKIVEVFEIVDGDTLNIDDAENTLSILNRYIDESETLLNRSIIKQMMENIYIKSCEVE